MNPRDWVRGCRKPSTFGAKASLILIYRCFCIVIALTFFYGRGAVGYKTGTSPKTTESLTY